MAQPNSAPVSLARNRFGVKPFYLSEVGGALGVASTLPALLAGGGVDTSIDPIGLHHYLPFHSVVPAPRTILAGVSKLPPATTLAIEPDGRRVERSYWAPAFERAPDRAAWSERGWQHAVLASRRTRVGSRRGAAVPVVCPHSRGPTPTPSTAQPP